MTNGSSVICSICFIEVGGGEHGQDHDGGSVGLGLLTHPWTREQKALAYTGRECPRQNPPQRSTVTARPSFLMVLQPLQLTVDTDSMGDILHSD